MKGDKTVNNKIRICLVIIGFHNGGIEKVIENYFKNMDRSKFDLHIITHLNTNSAREKEFKEMGFTIHKFKYFRGSRIKVENLIEYNNFFKENHFDIVYNNVVQNMLPLLFAKRYKVPVRVLHSHSDYIAAFEEKSYLVRKIFSLLICLNTYFATHYFACGERAAISVFGRKKVEAGKVTIVRNAINTNDFRYNPLTRIKIREALHLGDSLVVGHIGRYEDDNKNQQFVIDVFRELLKITPNSKLILIGEGKKREEIRMRAVKYGIMKQVIFTGAVSNVPDYLSAMDAFIFPSKFEGVSVTTLEAQCSGLTGIISDTLSPEMNELGVFIELSIKASAELWAKALYEHNIQSGARRDRSKDLCERGYDIRIEANKFQAMLEKLGYRIG